MTVLNERQAVIVRRLLDGECLSVSRLAASFETSERTIRGDLTTVQDVLTRYGLGLSEAAGQGLGVVATAAQSKALLSSPEMNEMASGQRVPFLAARMLLLGTSTYDQLAELWIRRTPPEERSSVIPRATRLATSLTASASRTC
ncbi:DeoR family transcriptional regulator [Parafannyhessea umbonata]|uniref:DeoR family transcriptional regulator n=1 Tax=Parafannyhessea umbonata TaxID=604330 RepID=UPI00117D69DA